MSRFIQRNESMKVCRGKSSNVIYTLLVCQIQKLSKIPIRACHKSIQPFWRGMRKTPNVQVKQIYHAEQEDGGKKTLGFYHGESLPPCMSPCNTK